MKLTVYTSSGAEAGRTVELDDAVFGIEPNDHAIWLDVKAIQAHKRQGTHKTKERGEVAKSTRKLYRQKGTGNARAGDAKSPLRKGGGTIFGPKPHEYRVGVNRKTRQLARRSAIAHKLGGDAFRVVETLALDAPKTRSVAEMLSGNGISGKTLVLTNGFDDVFYRSARNIPGVVVCPADQASTLDLMDARTIVLQEGALDSLTETLRPSGKATVAAPAPSASAAPADEASEADAPETDSQEAEASEAVAPAEPVIDAPEADEPVAPAEPVVDTAGNEIAADAQADETEADDADDTETA